MGSARTDYAYVSLVDTVRALRHREVTSAALTEAAIGRIEAGDGRLNAVVVRDFDRARAAARAADEALARGDDGALLGVPMTIKESYDLAGHPTTWGIETFKAHEAASDAVAVQKLKAAGAVILGKTNVPPALGDWQSDNPIYGRTNNPYDLARSPGGSSGGAAAALAAGFVPLEVGSDIGGSIRIPAAFCGLYGHKPSYGIVSSRGEAPGGNVTAGVLLAVAGPLARSAEDLALGFRVLAGPSGDQAQAWQLALRPPRCANTLKGMRVLLLDSHPNCVTTRSTKRAMAELGEELTAKGATVVRAHALLPDLAAQHKVYWPMLITIVSRFTPGHVPPSAFEWFDLLDAQARFRAQWARLFEEIDVVVTPTFGSAAFPHATEPVWEKRTLHLDGEETVYGHQLAWPAVATLPHLPATAFPIGRDEDGMPLGAQAIGGFGEDLTTLAFAKLAGHPFEPPRAS